MTVGVSLCQLAGHADESVCRMDSTAVLGSFSRKASTRGVRSASRSGEWEKRPYLLHDHNPSRDTAVVGKQNITPHPQDWASCILCKMAQFLNERGVSDIGPNLVVMRTTTTTTTKNSRWHGYGS